MRTNINVSFYHLILFSLGDGATRNSGDSFSFCHSGCETGLISLQYWSSEERSWANSQCVHEGCCGGL
jgi:hypothetical protein